jgi:hypothetical protein
MAITTQRLARRVRREFSADDAVNVLEQLRAIPEALPGGERQNRERLQAALVLPARGDRRAFDELLELAHIDWRDLLVAAELADDDWPKKLKTALGPRWTLRKIKRQ